MGVTLKPVDTIPEPSDTDSETNPKPQVESETLAYRVGRITYRVTISGTRHYGILDSELTVMAKGWND